MLVKRNPRQGRGELCIPQGYSGERLGRRPVLAAAATCADVAWVGFVDGVGRFVGTHVRHLHRDPVSRILLEPVKFDVDGAACGVLELLLAELLIVLFGVARVGHRSW